jgi:hypothetical protein
MRVGDFFQRHGEPPQGYRTILLGGVPVRIERQAKQVVMRAYTYHSPLVLRIELRHAPVPLWTNNPRHVSTREVPRIVSSSVMTPEKQDTLRVYRKVSSHQSPIHLFPAG